MKNLQLAFSISMIINVILIVCVGVLLYLFHDEIYRKITKNKKFTVVMFGNSLTSHCNWSESLNRRDVLNSGLPGFTTYNFIHALDKHVIKHAPKICFVEGGINDLGVEIPVSEIQKNYRKIISVLIQNKIEPVLQSVLYIDYPQAEVTQQINAQVDSLNVFLKKIAQENNLTYIELNKNLSENGRLKMEFHVDGLHLNKKAYKIWADEVNKILKEKRY